MFVFLGLLALSQLLSGSVVLPHAEFWIYPAQTICAAGSCFGFPVVMNFTR
jgi:hypothetical protein